MFFLMIAEVFIMTGPDIVQQMNNAGKANAVHLKLLPEKESVSLVRAIYQMMMF
jgi:hypothetical protein